MHDPQKWEETAGGFLVWENLEPDETRRITLESGHQVVAYSYGEGDETVFLLNGGPGLPCDYLRDPHLPLVKEGFRVVVHDQLGTGASDHPRDPSLWTMARYVAEVEAVLSAFDLDRVHFLGHSWGGWCGIEYALTHPKRIASMVLANTAADIPHLRSEIGRLRSALGPETVAMMQCFEAEERYDHPAYKAAVDLLDHRHIRRTFKRPAPVKRSKVGFNEPIFMAIQGPNEYCYTGSISDWNRVSDLARFDWPVLIVGGRHDVLTPACAAKMHHAIAGSEIKIFPASSHSPFYEEPEAYRTTLVDFLKRHPIGASATGPARPSVPAGVG
ncbi:proline iminopeptidase-family hydrolase [Jiella marina]|uniref:proline iminopeptidase-family hydrolase n=1 Tax=Jiella sp. LLJ827 TaxID=2917712 RepID=UPI002100CBF7|nr:proline iminopeptidase-family hydrolase [Jiella sp. LLJ827]MCQ0986126.1 proline iminopeptidase-family hydrolase [Jiella sp. LLJ827]